MKYASKWEELYAQHLAAQALAGEIADWKYEPLKILLAPQTTYTPDFMVIMPDGKIEMHEVKGYLRDDAAVKFKIAADSFPFWTFKMITRKQHEWQIMRIGGTGKQPKQQKAAPKPTAPVQPAKPVAKMTYNQMINDPELSVYLRLKPDQFHALRSRLGLTPSQIAAKVGLPGADSWEKLESGQHKLYYYSHVIKIKSLMEEK